MSCRRGVCLFALGLFISLLSIPAVAGVFPGATWQTARPAAEGLDSVKLAAAMNYLKGRSKSGGELMTQALLVRNGKVVWQGTDTGNKHNVWSVTKSFTGIALGLLVEDKKCSLTTLAGAIAPTVAGSYPELNLRHFTTLTSGYEANSSSSPWVAKAPNFTSGTYFYYGNTSMDMLAYLLTKRAQEPLQTLFKRRIADPIQMNSTKWSWGGFGTVEGTVLNGGAGTNSKGVSICATEVARVGLLLLNNGNWNGTQLLSSAWVAAASVPQTDPHTRTWWFGSNTVPTYMTWMKDLVGRYGYNFWVNGPDTTGKRLWPNAPPKTYALQGSFDNYCFVIPEWDMVFVRLSRDDYGLTDATNDYNTFFDYLSKAVLPISVADRAPGKNPPASIQCLTNPMTDRLEIRAAALAPDARWQLLVSDVRGNLVWQHSFPALSTRLSWDGKDRHGATVPDGIYHYTVVSGDHRFTGTVLKAR